MKDFFDMQSRFETDGVFWDPRDPEHTFSAHLSSAEHIELAESAVITGPEGWFSTPAARENVLGVTTTLGSCALIGLHELQGEGSLNSETGRGVISRRFRADACIIGCHLENDTAPLLRSGWFTCSGIEGWFPGSGEVAFTDAGDTSSYPRKAPAVIDFCLLGLRSHIELIVNQNLQFAPGGKRMSARSQPQIRIEPAQPRSLVWFMDVAWRFENFFSLCLGTSVRLRAVSLETSTGKTGWLTTHRRDIKAEKPDVQAWVICDYSRLAEAIGTWFALSEVFRPLENLVYGAIRTSSLVAETEFLSLAQAIESFHSVPSVSLLNSSKPSW